MPKKPKPKPMSASERAIQAMIKKNPGILKAIKKRGTKKKR